MRIASAVRVILFCSVCLTLSAFAQSSAASPQATGNNTPPQSASTPGSQGMAASSVCAAGGTASAQDAGALQSQIENAIRNEPTLGSSHINVKLNGDTIDLSGTVGSTKDKQTAERIAQSFDGNCKMNDTLAVVGHGHSDMAPEHSAMNNGGTGNAPNPATQGNNPQNPSPQK